MCLSDLARDINNCFTYASFLLRDFEELIAYILSVGQAIEIGAPAISFLIDTWEGHLTPPEAVSIADRASRGCDINIVRAAAELALSCLPHSHALNPNEIQRAILQVSHTTCHSDTFKVKLEMSYFIILARVFLLHLTFNKCFSIYSVVYMLNTPVLVLTDVYCRTVGFQLRSPDWSYLIRCKVVI